MTKKTGVRRKHVPQRTCVGCRQILAKRSLIRIVKTSEGVKLDPTGKAQGRGAYIHNKQSCFENSLKGALAHALRVELSELDLESLRIILSTIPDEAVDR